MFFYWSKSLGMTLYGCTFKYAVHSYFISIRNCHQRECNSLLHRKYGCIKTQVLKIYLSVCSSLSLCLGLSPLLCSFLEMESFYVVLAGLELAVQARLVSDL